MIIESYSFGQMIIDGLEYGKDLMILPDGEIVCPWWRKTGHELILVDIEVIVTAKPSILVIGTGSSGLMRPATGLSTILKAKGIGTVILPTKQAANEYNSLKAKESKVAACFHLTC